MSGLNDNTYYNDEEAGYFDPNSYNEALDRLTGAHFRKLISSTPPLLQYDNEGFSKILEDLQGNILRHHHKHFSRSYFIHFDPQYIAMALDWLSNISKNITTAKVQFDAVSSGEPSYFCGFYLTSSGYRALGLNHLAPSYLAHRSFSDGMETSYPSLFGKDGEGRKVYDEGIFVKAENGERLDTHAMLLIASDKLDFSDVSEDLKIDNPQWGKVAIQKGLMKKRPLDSQYKWVGENGEVLGEEGKKTMAVEWFGFRDGISQPLFFPEIQKIQSFSKSDLSPLRVALIKDPGSPKWNSAGSFLTVLKMEQDVTAFSEIVEKVRSTFSEIKIKPKDADLEQGKETYGDYIKDKELAEAYIMGRFRDGTPVTLSNQAKNNLEKHPENQFGYSDRFISRKNSAFNDESGTRCPFFAHIRKMNPRNEEKRLIVRRGMLYDDRVDSALSKAKKNIDGSFDIKEVISWEDWGPGNPEPSKGLGMLFMSFQSSLEQQFEHIMKEWAQSPSGFGKNTGVDMLTTSEEMQKNSFWFVPKTWNAENEKDKTLVPQQAMPAPVRFKGGEYFFAPSLTFLQRVKLNSSINIPTRIPPQPFIPGPPPGLG
ncbi:MAG: hypothetical protein IPH04_17420 [Saprospirales bacterium]|nr:hypothetical protein [Saprospirales bacterium]